MLVVNAAVPEALLHLGVFMLTADYPLERLELLVIAALPRDREIIAYCRGSYCVLSFDAVEALRRRGFQARRLEEGFPEWKAAELVVEAA